MYPDRECLFPGELRGATEGKLGGATEDDPFFPALLMRAQADLGDREEKARLALIALESLGLACRFEGCLPLGLWAFGHRQVCRLGSGFLASMPGTMLPRHLVVSARVQQLKGFGAAQRIADGGSNLLGLLKANTA